jgi:hypothetical protein
VKTVVLEKCDRHERYLKGEHPDRESFLVKALTPEVESPGHIPGHEAFLEKEVQGEAFS